MKNAVLALVNRLEGALLLLFSMHAYPDTMLVVRKRSPLLIGSGDGEMFVASDMLAFAGKTNKLLFLPDESYAFVRKNKIELYDFKGKCHYALISNSGYPWTADLKQGYEHFMLKEIMSKRK